MRLLDEQFIGAAAVVVVMATVLTALWIGGSL